MAGKVSAPLAFAGVGVQDEHGFEIGSHEQFITQLLLINNCIACQRLGYSRPLCYTRKA